MTSRPLVTLALGSLPLLLVLSSAACKSVSEEEALAAAREEVRREMQPEIEHRQREIEDLKRQIEAARARLASRQQRQTPAPSR